MTLSTICFRSGIALRLMGLLPVLLLCCVSSLVAGDQDTKGKEFWVTFMANGGNSVTEMRLYAACDKPTTVRIVYGDMPFDTADVNLFVANQTVEININSLFTYLAELQDGIDNGVSKKSFLVTANDDITLYGSSSNFYSADAFLALPTKVLTRRYIALGYTNGMFRDFTGDTVFDNASEFAIIGTEDNTVVRITPPTGLHLNNLPDQPFTITLQRGEVYFAEAATGDAMFGIPGSPEDVSGTEIVANKPVAVHSGCRRTSVPTDVGNFRDHLCEQMPALESWGKEAIAIPFYNITPSSPYTAVVRVIAAEDNTPWTLNGVAQTPLKRGMPVEFPIGTIPLVIRATMPILVGQYEHSCGMYDFNNTPELGDPFFLVLPPSEQFDTAYPFQCVTYNQFQRHFINVVVPLNATNSLLLDGQPVVAQYKPVPGTNFTYAQVEISNGAHYIRCDSAFGFSVYGYGPANSYGYNGGMLFRNLLIDYYPPELLTAYQCGGFSGIVYDSRITDSGVDSCFFISGESTNVNATVQSFTPGADTVWFSASLLDPFKDGHIGLKCIDSMGRSRLYKAGIPGFTLQAVGMSGNNPVITDTLFIYNDNAYCKQIVVENYGKYSHQITQASLNYNPTQAIIRTPLPITISPGSRATIEICVSTPRDTAFSIDLAIQDTCLKRTVATVPVVRITDTTAPSIIKPFPCGNNYTITFSESSGTGIQDIQLDTILNGSMTFDPPRSALPANTVYGHIVWNDRRQDLIYQVALKDRAGNMIVERDTVGGFTIAALDRNKDTVGLRFSRDWQSDSVITGSSRCDSISLTNYGLHPVQIASATLRQNKDFSIPPSQLPIQIPPQSTRRIAVCILGNGNEMQYDTLIVGDGCGVDELVALQAPTRPINGLSVGGSGNQSCNPQMQFRIYSATKRTFLSPPSPNPVTDNRTTLDIGLQSKQSVTIELHDLRSEHVVSLMSDSPLPEGIHRLSFNTGNLPSGAYVVLMRTSDGTVYVQKMLISK